VDTQSPPDQAARARDERELGPTSTARPESDSDPHRALGDRDVTIVQLPELDHLFQTARTGAPGEYADIEETIAPVALDRMGKWINAGFESPDPPRAVSGPSTNAESDIVK
jgi:hypothetical protein